TRQGRLDRCFSTSLARSPPRAHPPETLRRPASGLRTAAERVADGKTIIAMGNLAREVEIASHVSDFVVRLVLATHPESPRATPQVKRYVRYGVSPRGAQAIVLGAKILALMEGRFNVAFGDIRSVALPALRHRMILNFEAEAGGTTADDVLNALVQEVPESAA